MLKYLFTIFFCLFLGGVAWAQDTVEKPTGRKYAVLVGVNDYVRLRKLRFTKNDIEALRDELIKIGFDKKNVYCLTSGASEEKNRPTKENIELIIEEVLRMAKHGDIVVIAMSGHGVEVGGQARFCPPDTKDNPVGLEDSTVAIGDIFKKFERCDATFKLMLIDACREDPFRAKNVANAKALGTLDDPPKGVMLLQSCAKGELSYEDDDLKHGIFTHYLVEGLRGEAANKKGEVTLMGLATYVIEETHQHALDQLRARQQPYLKGEITDFVLTVNMTSPLPPPPPTLPASYLADNGAKFVRIEAGEFMMGDTLTPEEVDKKYPGGKVEWYKDAHPRHKVKISKPFYMAAHQVTVAEFRLFVDATKHQTTAEKEGKSRGLDKDGTWKDIDGLSWKNPGIEQESNHPVVHVSWHDATAYVAWMNKTHLPKEAWAKGWRYALPTEAQWEYACRAGTTTDFFWGDTAEGGKGYLNGAGKEGSPIDTTWSYPFPFDDGYKATSPVGTYKPNKWGLYDMHGNVWEWCSDWYGAYPGGSVTDPTGPTNGSSRVLRGGCWINDARYCRSADRLSLDPTYRSDSYGVRPALVRD